MAFDDMSGSEFNDQSNLQHSRRIGQESMSDAQVSGLQVNAFKNKLSDNAPVTLDRGGEDSDSVDSIVESEQFKQATSQRYVDNS